MYILKAKSKYSKFVQEFINIEDLLIKKHSLIESGLYKKSEIAIEYKSRQNIPFKNSLVNNFQDINYSYQDLINCYYDKDKLN